MDALCYIPHEITAVPRPWYECCACAQTQTPIGGCGCVCHETREHYTDEEYNPQADGYTLLDIDTRRLWARPVRVDGAGIVVEALIRLLWREYRAALRNANRAA